MLVEVVEPVGFAVVATGHPVDEVGGQILLVEVELVLVAQIERPVDVGVEPALTVEEAGPLRDLDVQIVRLPGVPDRVDDRLGHLQGPGPEDGLVGRVDDVVAVFQEPMPLEDAALRQEDVAELAGLIKKEGDLHHEGDLLERLDGVDGRAVGVDGVAAVDHQHIEVVVHPVLCGVEDGLPGQIGTRVPVGVVLPQVDGRGHLPWHRLRFLLGRHHSVGSGLERRPLFGAEKAAGDVGGADQTGDDLDGEVLVGAVGGRVGAALGLDDGRAQGEFKTIECDGGVDIGRGHEVAGHPPDGVRREPWCAAPATRACIPPSVP